MKQFIKNKNKNFYVLALKNELNDDTNFILSEVTELFYYVLTSHFYEHTFGF